MEGTVKQNTEYGISGEDWSENTTDSQLIKGFTEIMVSCNITVNQT